jgi:hypothetical protein
MSAAASVIEQANNVMTVGTATNHDRRQTRADQVHGDTMSMWAIYFTSPNVLTSMGYRVAEGGIPPTSPNNATPGTGT